MKVRVFATVAAIVPTALAGFAPIANAAPETLVAPLSGMAPRQGVSNDDAAGGWRVALRETKAARKAAEKAAAEKEAAGKADAKKGARSGDAKSGKPEPAGSFGEWSAFKVDGSKDKTCYALATPKERSPQKLKRDPAYVFISTRPAEKVRNEVSVIMGFSMKDGGEAHADVGGANFDLVAKGANAWIKNPAEEARFVDALKKGSKLVVKAASAKGNVTTDTYSLGGISDALDRIEKDCR